MPSASNQVSVSTFSGILKITIVETATNRSANTSDVQVTGTLINNNSGASNGSGGTTCAINGSGHFPGGAFNATVAPSGGTKIFIQHTFTITHDSDGSAEVTFTVDYGATGTAIFGSNKNVSATLTLTLFASAPDPPTDLALSNILPTSLTATWTPPANDGGWPISHYLLVQYKGTDTTTDTSPVQYNVTGTTKNITGLTAGQDYTFEVYAYNGQGGGDGYSTPSDSISTSTLAGCWIRVDGVWKVAIPYVRVSGVWKMAVPWIRVAGVWQQTH